LGNKVGQKEVELSKLEIEVDALQMVAPGEAEPGKSQQIRLASGTERNKKRGT